MPEELVSARTLQFSRHQTPAILWESNTRYVIRSRRASSKKLPTTLTVTNWNQFTLKIPQWDVNAFAQNEDVSRTRSGAHNGDYTGSSKPKPENADFNLDNYDVHRTFESTFRIHPTLRYLVTLPRPPVKYHGQKTR